MGLYHGGWGHFTIRGEFCLGWVFLRQLRPLLREVGVERVVVISSRQGSLALAQGTWRVPSAAFWFLLK